MPFGPHVAPPSWFDPAAPVYVEVEPGKWLPLHNAWKFHAQLKLKYGKDATHAVLDEAEKAHYRWSYGPGSRLEDYYVRVPPGGRRYKAYPGVKLPKIALEIPAKKDK